MKCDSRRGDTEANRSRQSPVGIREFLYRRVALGSGARRGAYFDDERANRRVDAKKRELAMHYQNFFNTPASSYRLRKGWQRN